MGVPPPSLLGKQSQSGNIRSTVGQYWLIIKKNGQNSVKFVGNCVNFVGNFVISGKVVWCFEKFWYVRKIFGPLKWYNDQNFFGDGGGEVFKLNLFRKKIFRHWSGKSEKVGQISFRPPNFSLPVRPCFLILVLYSFAVLTEYNLNHYKWIVWSEADIWNKTVNK
jgi:hypothetical protein